MSEIQRADPAARRQAVLLVIAGALVGALLIVAFERYLPTLREWLLAEPAQLARRVRLGFLVSATALSAPLLAFAVYLWLYGTRVLRTRQSPPPGYRVIRDTPLIGGQAAVSRGRGFRVFALCLAVASVVLWLLFWRLASLLTKGAA